MVKSFTQALSFGVLLTLAAACSQQSIPAPVVGAQTRSANNAPADPGTDPPGPVDTNCTDIPPTQQIKDVIKAKTLKRCRENGWTIRTNVTPPDGITYGLGCEYRPYQFSVDVYVPGRGNTYASGLYDTGSGDYTLTL